MMKQVFTNDWQEVLQEEFQKPYYIKLNEFLLEEYASQTIYPHPNDVFNALEFTAFDDVKVVILGQDPYHGPGQAHGLSFSVKPGIKTPPSLVNILKELQSDLGCAIPDSGYLVKWAQQGVLLLNTVLTVRKGQAHSHKGKGWETFTDEVIRKLSGREKPVIFLLWGRPAQEKMKLIDTSRNPILSSPHPSPLSARRGFFGSKPFSEVNRLLTMQGEKTIDWQIEDL